jgi:hypothetical protein
MRAYLVSMGFVTNGRFDQRTESSVFDYIPKTNVIFFLFFNRERPSAAPISLYILHDDSLIGRLQCCQPLVFVALIGSFLRPIPQSQRRLFA